MEFELEDNETPEVTPAAAEPTTEPAAAPATEPAAAEPAAEATPVEPPTEPAGQIYDFDAENAAWNEFDPYAENASEFFPEYLRPVHQRLHQVYDARVRSAKGDGEYWQNLYEAAISGSSDTPAVAQIQQELDGYKSRYEDLEGRYEELQKWRSSREESDFEAAEAQQNQLFSTFWEKAKAEIGEATPEQRKALMDLVDLPHKDHPDLLFFDSYEDAWAIAKAGKEKEAIELHGQGVPAQYIPKLVIPAAAAPSAPSRPQPAPTAAITAGADDSPAPVETTPVDSTPKPVHKVKGLSHRARLELAVERAQARRKG